MISKNSRLRKYIKLFLWISLLLLLLFGSSAFLAAKMKGSQHSIVAYTPQATSTSGITPTPSPTPSPTATLLPSSTPAPLFSDYFVDNSKGWYTGNASGYTRTLSDGGLTLSATNHKILIESLPANTSFGDFTISVSFLLLKADEHDSVGVYLRGDNNLDNDYRIDIYGNNTYSASKESLNENKIDETIPLIDQVATPLLLSATQINTLTVIMKGPNFLIMINGRAVSAIFDSEYTHGQIALFVQNGNTSDGVTATFSHIEIRPVVEEVPVTPTVTPDGKPTDVSTKQ